MWKYEYIRRGFYCLKEAGVGIEEFRAVGGLAKSEYFLQLKADMTGKKISSLNVSEAGTVGVSILAGTACGVYKSLEDGVSKLVRVKKVFYPNHEITEIYNKKFERYKNVYPAVKSVYRMDKEGF
jgi:xylulokinase